MANLPDVGDLQKVTIAYNPDFDLPSARMATGKLERIYL